MTATEHHADLHRPLDGFNANVIIEQRGPFTCRLFIFHEKEAVTAIYARQRHELAERVLKNFRRLQNERIAS